jgi:hypothetical protein
MKRRKGTLTLRSKLDFIPTMWKGHMARLVWQTPLVYVLLGDKSEYALKALMLMIGALALIDLKSNKVADVEYIRPTTKAD